MEELRDCIYGVAIDIPRSLETTTHTFSSPCKPETNNVFYAVSTLSLLYLAIRVSEELAAESIRDETTWSSYVTLARHLDYFISVA